MGVDIVFNWGFSVDGLLSDGVLGLLGEVTSLLDLEAELLSQSTLHVDSPLGSILLSADALKSAVLVASFEGSFNPLLVLLRDVHFLFLGGGGRVTRRVLLVALAALRGLGSLIVSLLSDLNGLLDLWL